MLPGRLVDFFHRMKVVLPSCDHGNLIHDHLEELKKKFCILAALNFKFKRWETLTICYYLFLIHFCASLLCKRLSYSY